VGLSSHGIIVRGEKEFSMERELDFPELLKDSENKV
jgi:hypothetical protein